jgi:natural resistance-associated macrophage protein
MTHFTLLLLCGSTGLAATTTATYAGQILMSGFFELEMSMAASMLITRACALGPAVAIALAATGDPGVQARMNEWLNVLQSLQLPFALIPVLHFTSSASVMGQEANSIGTIVCCWLISLLVLAVNLFLLYTTLPFEYTTTNLTFTTAFVLVDYCFILYLSKEDLLLAIRWLRGGSRLDPGYEPIRQ